MTALNFQIAGSRAFIMQDAASIDMEGRLVELQPKCLPVPEWRAAVASAGPWFLSSLVRRNITKDFAGIDDLAANGDAYFIHLIAKVRAQLFDAGWPWMPLLTLIAGWSEEQGRIRSVIFSDNLDEVFVIDQPGLIDPFDPKRDMAIMHAYFDALLDSGGEEHFDPVKHGLPLMERQRLLTHDTGHRGEPIHTIGGHVEVTEIDRQGVTQRIIHRWPEDAVGMPIRPKLPVSVSPPSQSN